MTFSPSIKVVIDASNHTYFFDLFLTQWIIVILSKGCKPDDFEFHNSLKLSFTNIRGIRSNFVECESFLESNSLDILAPCNTDLDDSVGYGSLSVRDYLSLIWKNSTTYMHGLSDFVNEGLPFTRHISLKNSVDCIMFSTSFTSLSILILFFFINHLLDLYARFLIFLIGFVFFHLT